MGCRPPQLGAQEQPRQAEQEASDSRLGTKLSCHQPSTCYGAYIAFADARSSDVVVLKKRDAASVVAPHME